MTPTGPYQVQSVSKDSLPSAAQRWLDRALPQDYEIPSSILIEQEGTMDIRGRWTPFRATGEYKASPLSFDWKARLQVLPGVWILAEDGQKDGQGWGGARLWGMIPMGKRTDPEVLAGQMVRNLGELPWLPAFALADPSLNWNDLDESTFEVRWSIGDQEVMVRFEINGKGDVIRAYSPARVYDIPGGYAEAPWQYEFGDHQEFSGVWIPGTAVASFEKSDGRWEYFRGRITAVTSR